MSPDPWSPVLVDLAAWVGVTPPPLGPLEADRLELRDTRLTEVRALLCRAEDLIHDVLAQHRPESAAPTAAGELNLIADRLDRQHERFEGSQENPELLRRAAILCAGHEWARLGGLLPGLRVRLCLVAEAMAETAVGMARLRRCGPHLSVAPLPRGAALLELEAAEQLVDDELRRRTARSGADSAYAAADCAFLPSLADFLR